MTIPFPHRAHSRLRNAQIRLRPRLAAVVTPGLHVAPDVAFGRHVRVRVDDGGTIRIGAHTYIDDGVLLEAAPGGLLEIGTGCFIGYHCTLSAIDRLEVGDGAYIAEMVTLRDHDHVVGLAPGTGQLVSTSLTIGRDVWLASKVTVVRGANVGDGSVVGANSVVLRPLPPGVLAAGAPATVRRSLMREPPPANGTDVRHRP